MGRSKPLLRVLPEGQSFVERAISTLRRGGLEQVAVVGRAGDEPLRAELTRIDPSIPYLVNPTPEFGQLSSVLVGLSYAESRAARAMLMLPVDIPLVRPETVAVLLQAFEATSAAIVRPLHAGRHGHPVIFRAAIFDALRRADMSVGAKDVLRKHQDDVLNVPVTDPGVARDIDLPEDYRDAFSADPG
jgi:molybdenum cofactor cytidylyltransferase